VVWCVTVHTGELVCDGWTDWTALTSARWWQGWHLKVGSASGPALTLTREILALTSTVHPSLAAAISLIFLNLVTTRSDGNTPFTTIHTRTFGPCTWKRETAMKGLARTPYDAISSWTLWEYRQPADVISLASNSLSEMNMKSRWYYRTC
jgi:hypothetical protein